MGQKLSVDGGKTTPDPRSRVVKAGQTISKTSLAKFSASGSNVNLYAVDPRYLDVCIAVAYSSERSAIKDFKARDVACSSDRNAVKDAKARERERERDISKMIHVGVVFKAHGAQIGADWTSQKYKQMLIHLHESEDRTAIAFELADNDYTTNQDLANLISSHNKIKIIKVGTADENKLERATVVANEELQKPIDYAGTSDETTSCFMFTSRLLESVGCRPSEDEVFGELTELNANPEARSLLRACCRAGA